MPRLTGFGKHEFAMKQAMRTAGAALVEAASSYVADEGEFNKKFKTYFGKINDQARDDLVATLANMNGQFQRDNFTIALGAPNANENANMIHFKTAHYQVSRDEIYQATMTYLANNPALSMIIRPIFFNLPFEALNNQSQVETFLHELSHFAAGTIDYKPPRCYEMTGVNYCKSAGVEVAVRNAENVGFFIASYVK